MDVIFVRTRWHYGSYDDFWRLVELSGFPICYTDEVEIDRDVVYILSPINGEWRPHIDSQKQTREHKAELYLYNLERHGITSPMTSVMKDAMGRFIDANRELISGGYVDDIIVPDRRLARLTGFRYMAMGGHSDFGTVGNMDSKMYDLAAMSCYSFPHRSWMFKSPGILHSHLNGLTIAPNAGPGTNDREKFLRTSKAMLNIHQDGLPFTEPIRMILAISYGLPIFTEDCDTDIYPAYKFSIGVESFKEYAPTIKGLLTTGYKMLYDNALATKHVFSTEHSFYNCVMRSI